MDQKKKTKQKKFVKKQIREALDQNPKFKAFLEQNHVEGRYIRNVTQSTLGHSDIESRLDSIKIIIQSGGDIIDWSFTWSLTPEGHVFWNKLSKKYREINSNY